MRGRTIAVLVILVLGLCCLATVGGGVAYFFLVPTAAAEARPVVLISSPTHGQQVELGETVIVQALARDETNVVRVELWVDGELLESQSSTLPEGITPFPLLVNWQPLSPGTHTLIVRAFNIEGARGQGSVTVEAAESADRDGDGLADEADLCPDEPGSADGCPDRDRDGIPDATDACPDEAGLPEGEGCASPGQGDRDGDGLLDTADACPDEPGPPRVGGCPDADGDGVADADDACPAEPGLPEHDGCTVPGDLDGDGVADPDDVCVEEWGLPEHDGCPDFDGDAIPDASDACPDVWGLPAHDGCPDTDLDGVADPDDPRPDDPDVGDDFGDIGAEAPDSDGDGIPDEFDICPAEEGLLEHDGCPPPDSADADADGTADIDEPPWGDSPEWDIEPFWPRDEPIEAGPLIEFQALELELFDDYSRVYCYASLGHGAEERVPQAEGEFFSPGDERHWNIDEHLGRRFVPAVEDEAFRVHADCFAVAGILGLQILVDLGSFEAYHQPPWEGDVVEAFSDPGPEGDYFRAEYRLCEGSCEEARFAAPVLHPFSFGPGGEGPAMLRWSWDGDETQISGFRVYVNGTFLRAVGTDVRLFADLHEHEITDLWPTCDERLEFSVTTVSLVAGGPDRESPPSNSQTWEGTGCERTVRVTFQSLETSGLGVYKGPVKGTFTANDQTLTPDWRGPPTFDATDYTYRYLEQGRTYDLFTLFGAIESEATGCLGENCTDNYAPLITFVEVDLAPHDALTFSGSIWDDDGNRVFDGSDSIRPGEIIPGPYTVVDRGIELTVLIDVLVGPEVGDRPDLVVSDIMLVPESNQLRIEVFNRAAFLENEALTIRAESLDGELLDTTTWPNQSIGSGDHQLLGTTLVLDSSPIYDLRLIIDPDNTIEETEEGELNNVYETPVLMRVEFDELAAYPCESFLSGHSEVWFVLWAGYGPSRGEVNWAGGRRRYPSSGILRLDTYEAAWIDDPDAWAHWYPSEAEPGRFIVEFEMPADENLYIMASGYENDVFSDDFLGHISADYGPDVNYGHRPDERYHDESDNQGCSDEGAPISWDYFGLGAWWRITRVH
jgi:hypothetical protein